MKRTGVDIAAIARFGSEGERRGTEEDNLKKTGYRDMLLILETAEGETGADRAER